MTRIEILNEKLVGLKKDYKRNEQLIQNLENKRSEEHSRFMLEYFGDLLQEGDKIETSFSTVSFLRPRQDSSYFREVVGLYFGNSNWREEDYDEISTSYQSSNSKEVYDLKRMVLIGEIGKVILDYKDDILGGFNQIRNKYKEELSTLQENRFTSDKVINQIEDKIKELKKENLIYQLETTGIEIPVPKDGSYYNLPSLDITHDFNLRFVKGLRILSKTKSGKSCDIEVVRLVNIWDDSEEKYVLDNSKSVFEKVRMKNIERFLQIYSDQLKK